MLTLLLCAIVILVCLFFNWWNPKNFPPGPKNWLGVGVAFEIWRINLTFPFLAFIELGKKYGDIMYVPWGVHHSIVINKYEDMKELLTKHEFHARYEFEYVEERTFGKWMGVLFSSNKIWTDTRRFCQKQLSTFGFRKSETLGKILRQEFLDFAASLEKSIENDSGLVTIDFTFDKPVTNILWKLTFGFESKECLERLHIVTDANEQLLKIFTYTNLFLPFPFLIKALPRLSNYYALAKTAKDNQDIFQELVQESRKRQKAGEDPFNFVQAFTKEIQQNQNTVGTNFTEENLIATLLDIFLAGTETLSRFLDYLILYLVMRTDVQDKIYDEICLLYPDGGVPAWSDTDKMPYTQAVIFETLRLANVVPMPTPRRNIVDYEYKGYTFPKGACIAFNLFGVLSDPVYWGNDVDKFCPERFIDPHTGKLFRTERVAAFGFGKRICLGEVVAKQAAFFFLTGLVQKFKISQPPNSRPLENNSLPGFTSRPKPFQIVVAKR